MCLKIKRKSVWIDFHDGNEAVAIMIGDDGCQVPGKNSLDIKLRTTFPSSAK